MKQQCAELGLGELGLEFFEAMYPVKDWNKFWSEMKIWSLSGTISQTILNV